MPRNLIIPSNIGTNSLFIECQQCHNSIELKLSTQKALAHGNGLGHLCTACKTRYIIVQCPSCMRLETLNSQEWEQIRKQGTFHCAHQDCGETSQITLKREALKASAVSLHTLSAWSDSELEADYLECLKSRQNTLASFNLICQTHAATGSRLQSVEETLFSVKEQGIRTWEIYNNNNLSDQSDTKKYDAEDAVFRICNALVSSLETLTQETFAVLNINLDVGHISFNDAATKLEFTYPELQETFKTFKETSRYKYLNKLRRCIHHWWAIPYYIESKFTLEQPGPISEAAFPSQHLIYLPDKPNASLNKITFSERIEFLRWAEETKIEIEQLALNVYAKLRDRLRKNMPSA